MPFDLCIEQQVGRRRVFWTTQPLVCGEYFLCGSQCVVPGLEYIDTYVRQDSHILTANVHEGAAAADAYSVTADESAALTESATAVDDCSASVDMSDSMMESATADSMQDATLISGADTHMRILSASRAGMASAVVNSGKTQVVSDIGAVT
jgi:hypothetical protein